MFHENLRDREGFHRVRSYNGSSEYAQMITGHFCLILFLVCDRPKPKRNPGLRWWTASLEALNIIKSWSWAFFKFHKYISKQNSKKSGSAKRAMATCATQAICAPTVRAGLSHLKFGALRWKGISPLFINSASIYRFLSTFKIPETFPIHYHKYARRKIKESYKNLTNYVGRK